MNMHIQDQFELMGDIIIKINEILDNSDTNRDQLIEYIKNHLDDRDGD